MEMQSSAGKMEKAKDKKWMEVQSGIEEGRTNKQKMCTSN